MRRADKPLVVALSGGFAPLHTGHLDLIESAHKLNQGNVTLVAIVNNDNWLRTKKKGFVFMPEDERARIIGALRGVDKVIITSHAPDDPDRSVCRELEELRADIFGNGGDRSAKNIPEYDLCDRLGIRMVFNLGEKRDSSSEIVARVLNHFKDKSPL